MKIFEIIWYLVDASLYIKTGLNVILAFRNASVNEPFEGACLELYRLTGL